jgi:hypothetical protein
MCGHALTIWKKLVISYPISLVLISPSASLDKPSPISAGRRIVNIKAGIPKHVRPSGQQKRDWASDALTIPRKKHSNMGGVSSTYIPCPQLDHAPPPREIRLTATSLRVFARTRTFRARNRAFFRAFR